MKCPYCDKDGVKLDTHAGYPGLEWFKCEGCGNEYTNRIQTGGKKCSPSDATQTDTTTCCKTATQ